MTHANGYASIVELFDINIVYVALNDPNGVDKSFMEERLRVAKAGIQHVPQITLQYKPVMMRPAQYLRVFGAMPGKLRLEITYDDVVESVSYSGAYAIHWASVPIKSPVRELHVPKVVSEVAHKVLRERVADLCHQLWAEWTQDILAQIRMNDHGTWTLPSGVHDKLNRKLLAKYPSVSWEDRDAYRAQADKFIECILVQGTSQ